MDNEQRTGVPDELEDRLRRALERLQAPDGFTDRVMERAAHRTGSAAGPHRRRGRLLQFTRPVWRAAYAAAAALAITAGAVHVEHVREQRRADLAAAQFDEAMQVTSHALDQVSAKLETTQFGDLTKALDAKSGGGR